jgi:hypothetical protein
MGVPAHALTSDALCNPYQAMTKLGKFGQESSQVVNMSYSSIMLAIKSRQVPLDDLEHVPCLKGAKRVVKID